MSYSPQRRGWLCSSLSLLYLVPLLYLLRPYFVFLSVPAQNLLSTSLVSSQYLLSIFSEPSLTKLCVSSILSLSPLSTFSVQLSTFSVPSQYLLYPYPVPSLSLLCTFLVPSLSFLCTSSIPTLPFHFSYSLSVFKVRGCNRNSFPVYLSSVLSRRFALAPAQEKKSRLSIVNWQLAATGHGHGVYYAS